MFSFGRSRPVAQYLERYAEPEARAVFAGVEKLVASSTARWEAALVVPVHREPPSFLDGHRSALEHTRKRILRVLVVNAPTGASAVDVAADQRLVAELEQSFRSLSVLSVTPRVRLAAFGGSDLLLVERCASGFEVPRRQGVGLARKLGNDLALVWWAFGLLDSPWFFQSDADVELPRDYFDRELGTGEGARVLPFRHVGGTDPDVTRRTLLVEASLRYHVLGMRWARSRNAYHTIGSCLVLHAASYAAVRGFPKRAAGEDFHVLDKIRKLADIRTLPGEPLRISARASDRTPFGTGRAVAELAERDLLLEHPACYAALGHWLTRLERFVETRDERWLRASHESAQEPWLHALDAALEELGAFGALTAVLPHTRSREDLRTRVYGWFGGLESVRLLRGIRARGFAQIQASRACAEAPFLRGLQLPESEACVGAWSECCERLAELELAEVA